MTRSNFIKMTLAIIGGAKILGGEILTTAPTIKQGGHRLTKAEAKRLCIMKWKYVMETRFSHVI